MRKMRMRTDRRNMRMHKKMKEQMEETILKEKEEDHKTAKKGKEEEKEAVMKEKEEDKDTIMKKREEEKDMTTEGETMTKRNRSRRKMIKEDGQKEYDDQEEDEGGD